MAALSWGLWGLCAFAYTGRSSKALSPRAPLESPCEAAAAAAWWRSLPLLLLMLLLAAGMADCG